MSEEIYVLNDNGCFCGLKNRQEVHSKGILHSAVQCWVMNTKGEVLKLYKSLETQEYICIYYNLRTKLEDINKII